MFTHKSGKRIALAILLLSCFSTQASHIVGGAIYYVHLGGLNYELYLDLYRDCAGSSAPRQATINLYSDNCNYRLNYTLPRVDSIMISPLCPNSPAQTRCSGGSFPGIERYRYQAVIQLPQACDDWLFSWDICCRNGAITNIQGGRAYFETTLDNFNFSGNNSPIALNLPVPFVCVDQPFFYSGSEIDPDGDSLAYSIQPSRSAQNAALPFVAGLSPSYPLLTNPPNGFVFDSLTGHMAFTPFGFQNAAITVQIDEFRQGELIATTYKDLQVVVIDCQGNEAPFLDSLLQIKGGAQNGTQLFTCGGDSLQFTVSFSDPNSADSLQAVLETAIPHAHLQVQGDNPLLVTVSLPTDSLAPGKYPLSLRIRDNGCPLSQQQSWGWQLVVQEPFRYQAQVFPPRCFGHADGEIILTVTDGNAPFRFHWSNGGTDSVATGLMAGTHHVQLFDSLGCRQDTSFVLLQPAPLEIETIYVSEAYCNRPNGEAMVSALGGTEPYTYSWLGQAGPHSQWLEDQLGGTYTVALKDAQGCSLLHIVTIPARTLPQAAFTLTPLPNGPVVENEATFQMLDQSLQALWWQWEFGDGNRDTLQHPQHQYQLPGNYVIQLVVGDQFDCPDTARLTLEVIPDGRVYFPTAFTPNGDGINDRVRPIGEGMLSVHWTIFNRWGKPVFTSQQVDQAWDGTQQGLPVPEGVYSYQFEAQFNDGTLIRRAGTITLFR